MDNNTRQCQWCDTTFTTPYPTQEYCSRSHKEQAREHRRRLRQGKVKQIFTNTCPGCRTQFDTYSTSKVYCSSQCRAWVRTQVKNERDREYLNKKTPALKARLYWRDNGLCQICLQPVDTSLQYPHPLSFSIDHIIPRSVKPDHSFKNLRVTHLVCNLKRSNKPA